MNLIGHISFWSVEVIVNLLDKNINIMKKNTEPLLYAGKVAGLKLNAEKSK